MSNSAAVTIDSIAGCAARIEALCAGLDEAGWHTPTALPAWDVQDVVAHLGSLEAMFLGRDEPAHEPARTGHVRNPLGALNERMVDRRRAWTGDEVLEEFRETTRLRFEALSGLSEADLDHEVPAPTGGTVPLRSFLGIRLWDYVVHELDIADALGVDPELEAPAVGRVLDEMLMLLPRAVAKGGTPDGEAVTLTITGPLRRSLVVRMEGRRAVAADPATAGEAALHLRASPAAFLRVGAGRSSAAEAVARSQLHIQGDGELAARVLAAINVVP